MICSAKIFCPCVHAHVTDSISPLSVTVLKVLNIDLEDTSKLKNENVRNFLKFSSFDTKAAKV